MSENINVAIPVGMRNSADISLSSSSLSKLSRSPSPPVNAVLSTIRLQQPNEPTSDPQLGDTEYAVGIKETDAVPRKKRKMTGRTSKHFTPEKRSAGKRCSTTQETPTASKDDQADDVEVGTAQTVDPHSPPIAPVASPERPTRRTRASSKVEKTEDVEAQMESSDKATTSNHTGDAAQPQSGDQPPAHSTRSSTKKRKSTGKRSTYFTPTKPNPTLDPAVIDRVDFYNTTSSGKEARVPAGTSTAPVPPITAPRFGIIQEKLWEEPFWLLIAVTFLNKTTGRAAVPVFWTLKERYTTPEALAAADQGELCEMIHHLGLQNQRSRRMINIARAWVEQPPTKGRRGRTLHYPLPGNGKEFRPGEVVEEDASDCEGALEIAHLPGCGPYAWDSWRIFCRDVLRDVAADYDGAGADEGFVPEWTKVVPGDKELRACLRWMWLREGWIWGHESGEKRRATDEEMAKALHGEMEIEDPLERKFAAQAAGVEVSPFKTEEEKADAKIMEESKTEVEDTPAPQKEQPKTPEPQAEEGDESDNIVVTPVVSPARRQT
jgi:endonuclease III